MMSSVVMETGLCVCDQEEAFCLQRPSLPMSFPDLKRTPTGQPERSDSASPGTRTLPSHTHTHTVMTAGLFLHFSLCSL